MRGHQLKDSEMCLSHLAARAVVTCLGSFGTFKIFKSFLQISTSWFQKRTFESLIYLILRCKLKWFFSWVVCPIFDLLAHIKHQVQICRKAFLTTRQSNIAGKTHKACISQYQITYFVYYDYDILWLYICLFTVFLSLKLCADLLLMTSLGALYFCAEWNALVCDPFGLE